MSPSLNGSSTLERFECSNASKIRNGIIFDFYLGLPHIAKQRHRGQWNLAETIGLKLRLHVAIFVSRFTFKPAWNAHWCVYTRSLIVFIMWTLRRLETWLKVGALNRIQHEERETWGRTRLLLHALQTSLIPRPSHRPFLFAYSFNVVKQSKTGQWEGLRTTLLQIRPVLTSYLLFRPNSTIDSLRQIVIL